MSYIAFCVFLILLFTFGDLMFNYNYNVEYYLVRISNYPNYTNLVPYKSYLLNVCMMLVFVFFFQIVDVRLMRKRFKNKYNKPEMYVAEDSNSLSEIAIK